MLASSAVLHQPSWIAVEIASQNLRNARVSTLTSTFTNPRGRQRLCRVEQEAGSKQHSRDPQDAADQEEDDVVTRRA